MEGNFEDDESSAVLWTLKAKVPLKRRYYLRP